MKMTTIEAIIIGAMMAVASMTLVTLVSYSDTHYNRLGEIVSIENNNILVKDITGNVWEVETTDFHKHDKVILKMMDKHTPNNIYDDEVVKVSHINN